MTVRVTQLDITYASLFRVVAVALAVIAAYYLSDLIGALLFAIVVASAIEPGVRWLARYRVPRIAAVLIIYLIGLALIAGVITLILPAIVSEFTVLFESFPRYQRVLLQELRSLQNLPFYSFFSENAETLILNPPLDFQTIGTTALGTIFTIFGGIGSGLILIIVSFYLASQEQGIKRFLRLITPLRDEEYVIDLWARAQAKVGQWLRGQALLGVIVGVLVYLALTILGVRYALILALIAAILELIPVIGPILAAVPAVLFGFLASPVLGLIVALVYLIIQQLENHLFVPLIMQRTVGLNPLVVIIALLVGAKLGGVLGMFLAVPAAAVIVEMLTDMDLKRRGLFRFGDHKGE